MGQDGKHNRRMEQAVRVHQEHAEAIVAVLDAEKVLADACAQLVLTERKVEDTGVDPSKPRLGEAGAAYVKAWRASQKREPAVDANGGVDVTLDVIPPPPVLDKDFGLARDAETVVGLR